MPDKQPHMLEHMLSTLRKQVRPPSSSVATPHSSPTDPHVCIKCVVWRQIDKELLGLTFVQELVWAYFRHAEPVVRAT